MMKKEKLEQMKELGRGGLSKGLTMLRNAAEKAAAAADAANVANAQHATAYAVIGAPDDDDVATAAGGAAATTTGAITTTAVATANRLTYDELVSLSMKLTRQNKLMKTQFQKMQTRITALSTSEADASLLADFVKNIVGVDLDACHVEEGKAGGDGENGAGGDGADTTATAKATIDAKALNERYVILQELNEREHRRVEERLRAELSSLRASQSSVVLVPASNGVESVQLLSFSPVGGPPAPGMQNYDEIDLFSDPFPVPAAATTVPVQATVLADASDTLGNSESVARLERQLADARTQLKALETQLSMSVQEREELQQKYDEAVQDGAGLTSTLKAQEQELQQAVEELSNATRTHESSEQEWQVRWNEQNEVVAKIQVELQRKIEAEAGFEADNAAIKAELEELLRVNQISSQNTTVATPTINVDDGETVTLKDTIASLQLVVSEKDAKLIELESALASAHTDSKANGASAEAEAMSNDDSHASRNEEIAGLTVTVITLKEENESLQLKLVELKKSQDTAAASQDSLAPLLGELEKVKMERAEMDHTLRTLQEKLRVAESQLKASREELELNGSLVGALKENTSRLADELAEHRREKTESDRKLASLQEEVEKLASAKESLQEELSILRRDTHANLESTLAEVEETKRQIGSAELEKVQLESRMAEEREYLKSKIETVIKELDAANKRGEHLQSVIDEKEKQVKKMASSQASITGEMMELQKQISSMREDLHMAAEGLEAHAMRAEQSDLKRQEIEGKMTNMKLQMDSMRDQHRTDFEMLRQEKDAALERVKQDQNATVRKFSDSESARIELQAKFESLDTAYNVGQRRVAELEATISQQTTSIGNLSVDLAETKKALSDRMGLATRLQTENMGIAAQQAEQAALIENALREAAASKEKAHEMELKMQESKAEMARAKKIKADTVSEMKNMKLEMERQQSEIESEKERSALQFKAAVNAEKERFKKEIERIEADSKHKSRLAVQAVLEKEAEIKRLSTRLADLEEDVRSGDADHRKIFEVAQLQAKREAESRAQMLQLQEMANRLDEAYRHIQRLQDEKQQHDHELTALMQTQRREGVNMEYLKNVVVQYMSFRPGSSQQSRLIPVLSTLLQFSTRDMKEIKSASNARRSSWTSWGTETKDYKPILDGKGQLPPRPTMIPPSPASALGSFEAAPPRASSSFTLPHAMESASSDSSAFASHATSESADF